MKNKTLLLSFLISFFMVGSLFAQPEKIKRTLLMNPAEVEKAEGDKYYEMQGGAFRTALEHYLRAYVTDGYDPLLNYKIGVCYLSTINKIQAIPYFQKAYKIKPNITRDVHLLLGLSYQLNLQWDEAIKEYKQYKLTQVNQYTLPTDALQQVADQINKKIQECNYGREMVKHPVRVLIENLGDTVNTSFAEYAPLITADESMMYFTARKDNTTGGAIDPEDMEFYEDIYSSEKVNGRWSQPKNLGAPINTNLHDATAGLSADGQRMFIYNGSEGDGDLFECRLEGDTWSKPVSLGRPVNSRFHETMAALSYDQKRLFTVSDRPRGGQGGRDIYESILKPNGKWSKPKNLGKKVNTIYDEDGIFVLPDGKTLYFSSKGHNSMGGYDIFKTVWDDHSQQWSVPENLGYPINTPDDDIFLSLSANGKHGYFSSVKNNGDGEKDLYMITFLGPEKTPMLSEGNIKIDNSDYIASLDGTSNSTELTIFKGTVKDIKTGAAIEASFEITDNQKNSSVAVFKSNSKTGNFLITLPSGRNYGVLVKADQYLFHSENFDIPITSEYTEINKVIDLSRLEAGSSIVLNNIFFDHDKAILKSESITELENVFRLMKLNPTMKIEISGHTDNLGTPAYNKVLSDDRAKVVVDYIIKKGIDRNRIVHNGYGDTMPVASNETREGKMLNRRSEFKIISK